MRTGFFLSCIYCAGLLTADPGPGPRLPEQPDALLGPAAIQTFSEGTYFHARSQSTLADLPVRMGQLVPRIQKGLVLAGLGTVGPLLVVYHGLGRNPSTPFEVEVGVLVPRGTTPTGDCQVRSLSTFTCATMTYTGSMAHVDRAYEALYPALLKGGRLPNGESRQMILFWEDATSTNNMLLLQVGLQPVH